MQTWIGQGLRIQWVTLLLDDPNEGPPTIVGAQKWKTDFNLNSSAVAPDPFFSMVPGQSVGTPQTTVINPRTMQVQSLVEGLDVSGQDLVQIAQLAQQNKAAYEASQ